VRDVEFNYTASDRTGPATESVARRAKNTQDKIKRDQDKAFKDFTRNAERMGTIAGGKVGALFGENIAAGLEKMAPAMTPVLAGVAIAAAPVIGASIAAAVIGGSAGLGILGGVALAARSPQVASRAAALGDTIMGSLRSRAAVFIDPVLESLDIVEDRWSGIGNNISRLFANSARYVKPLTEGLTYAAERVTDLVARLSDVRTAGPVIEAIANGIAGLGDAINDAFSDLEDNGVDAAVAISQVFQVLEATIRAVGFAVNALTETYGVLAQLGLFGQRAQREYWRLSANAQLAAASNADVAISLEAVNSAGQGVAGVIANLAKEVGDLTQENRSLYASTTSAAEAISRTTETLRKNGSGLKLNTERGRENRQALANLATALAANYDAYVKVNGAGTGATQVANRNRAAFIALAEKAGYTSGKARALANELLGIPARRTPVVNMVGNAAARAQTVIDRLSAIRSKTVSVNVAVHQSGDAAALRKQSLPAFSAAAAASSSIPAGSYRTGGPAPVQVASRVLVNLDGRPFYDFTARSVRAADDRRAFRDRVGKR
jgi:hypothetical protein